jgi:HPr kinase/phosphorylase
MTRGASPSVHASAVLVGDRAVLIRGPSGAGKSRLAFDLILAGRSGQIPRAVLVGDDRVHLDTHEGQLTVRPARALAGLIEIHGLGIRRCERLPPPEALLTCISSIKIPRIPVGTGFAPFPLVVAALTTTGSSISTQPSADCQKGIGNHMRHTIATE